MNVVVLFSILIPLTFGDNIYLQCLHNSFSMLAKEMLVSPLS